ncbi:ATP-dependent Clp protease adaptor ClpS [bacterium]|nr:ATP-dependent Clp protease adaptor ClpS [bacterium]
MGSTKLVPEVQKQTEVDKAKLFQIILLDDDEHSYAYVIEMMMTLFSFNYEDALRIAYDVDYLGQATVKICPLEEAMVGREQINCYGPDHRLAHSSTSMISIVQAADQ